MKPFNNEQPEESRNNDMKLLDIFKKFENSINPEDQNDTCGNICSILYPSGVSFNDGKIERSDKKSFYELVSAPMLLSRFVAAGITPIVENNYKTTWSVILIHKETRCTATFYDFKGASSIGSCKNGITNDLFKKDLFKLTQSLINPRFPHPYDGCVVGEIA